jgi:glycyl-tRNA synthetase
MKKEVNAKMEDIISLCKRRGFIYQGSEIYGGLAGTWDYGPLGLALKNNIKNLWWKKFVTDRDDMYGVDAAILMNQNVWKATGHVGGFSDPLIECKQCKNRFRVDHLPINKNDLSVVVKEFKNILDDYFNNINKKHDNVRKYFDSFELLAENIKGNISEGEKRDLAKTLEVILEKAEKEIFSAAEDIDFTGWLIGQIEKTPKYDGFLMKTYLNRHIKCPDCNSLGKWGEERQFNMLFKTSVGAIESDESISYLRPETAQGMFVNYKNIIDSFHPKLPFGMGQIGKAFRNEIAPRDFIFRTREFEQMEIEYLVKPEGWQDTFEHLRKEMLDWTKEIGLKEDHVYEHEIRDEDRAFYSKRTIDFEFEFPFGRSELYGLAYRTDYDLGRHSASSGIDLVYMDEETKEKITPHCIEPSFGVDRTVLAIMSDAYTEDELGGEKRVYLKFSPKVAPVKIAVFPLLKNKPQLVDKAKEVYQFLKKEFSNVMFDDNGNIGKRYRRQDEIGTPYCVTVDFETIEKDSKVTIRNRDTGEQERIAIDDLKEYFKKVL